MEHGSDMWSQVYVPLENYHLITNFIANTYFIRSYWVSTNGIGTWSQAMQLCENMGRGLVKWDTSESYLDLKEMSYTAGFWTALTNTNGEDCDGASDCDGLLVMIKWKKAIS